MKKYSKILLVTALTALLVGALAFSANAATYTIKNATDFKTYLYDSSLWGGNHTYNITTDSIVLTGTQTPIGNNSTPFKGTINGDADGNGTQCTISGINISTSTAYTGFFGAAANSTFNDLILKGSVKSTYKGTTTEANGIVGGLLGHSRGNLTVSNVDSHLAVTSSGSAVGGIVGQVCMNTSGSAIRIEASTNQGAIKGYKHVGGIVGRVGGTDATHSLKGTVTIHNCKNIASITGTDNVAGGIIGYFHYINTTDLATLNVTYCSNTGAVKGGNYVGGIMGLFLPSTQKYNAALKMKVLHNRGTIDATNGSYKGGIVGCIYPPILDATTNKPANMFTLEDWQHVGLDKDEGLIGIIGKPGDGQNAAEITVARAYNMVGTQILRSKTTISGTIEFNYNNVTLNTCRNVNSTESAMTSLANASDLWKVNTNTGVVTLAAYGHDSHSYSNGKCVFCLACDANHGNDNRAWKYDSTAKTYYVSCSNCGERYLESITPPVVYVGTSGSDIKDGSTRATRVLTLKEAVTRLASTGGTVAICGQLPLDADIVLPAWSNTITFTADNSSGNSSFNSGGYAQAGFLIKKQDVQLQLNGNAIFNDIIFKANTETTHRVIISANWYNLEMKHIRSLYNATCYIIAGKYGETADSTTLTTTKTTNIKIDGPSLTDSFSNSVGYFYERIVLGSAPSETVTVKNKTVTLTVQDGYATAESTLRTEPALIYFLYAMSTADRLQTVYTENCTTNIYFNDNSMVHAFVTGSRNVGEAGTITFANEDGTKENITFTDGNAYLDNLNVYFNDNSNITDGLKADGTALNSADATSSDKLFDDLGRFFVKNTKKIVIKVSDGDGVDEYSGEGTRTTPIYHNLFFYRNGSFDSSSITATVTVDFGRHSFLASLGNKITYENGPAHDANTYAYTLTSNIDDECVWDGGVITTAPTPSKDGVKKFTCTICGRTKTEAVKHEHTYVVKADGTYYCYDFALGKAYAECAQSLTDNSVTVMAVPASAKDNKVTVNVTYTAKKAVAASVFKIEAPSGFVFDSINTNVPSTEEGTGLTITASSTNPCTVMLVQNAPTDAKVSKTVVLSITFDITAIKHSSTPHIVRVYGAESYTVNESAVYTDAVSAEVIVDHVYGDNFEYNGDGKTHARLCVCGDKISENCEWDNGVVATESTLTVKGERLYTCLVCGGTYTEELEYFLDGGVSFNARVTLLSEYVLEYVIPKKENATDCRMVFTYIDGGEAKTVTVEPVNVDALDTDTALSYDQGKLYFEAPGIAAKEMADVLKGEFYYVLGGELYKSPARSINLISYYRAVKAYNPVGAVSGEAAEALEKLLDSMFNYGAAAQKYFNYNTDKLATNYISGTVVDYAADQDAIDAIDQTVAGLGIGSVTVEGAESATFKLSNQAAVLEQRIATVLYFDAVDGAELNAESHLEFKGGYNNVSGVWVDVEAAKIDVVNNRIAVYIDRPAAKDLRVEFSGALYIDNVQASPTVTTSFELYAAAIINYSVEELLAYNIVFTEAKAIELKAVCRAALAYSDAAADYLELYTKAQ